MEWFLVKLENKLMLSVIITDIMYLFNHINGYFLFCILCIMISYFIDAFIILKYIDVMLCIVGECFYVDN